MAVVNLRLPLLQDPSLRLPSAKGNLAEEIVVLGEYRKNSMDYNINMNNIYIGIYYTIFYVYIYIYYIYHALQNTTIT